MPPEKKIQSPTLKKVNIPPGKIYFEIETPGKNHNQGTPWIFMFIPLYRYKISSGNFGIPKHLRNCKFCVYEFLNIFEFVNDI